MQMDDARVVTVREAVSDGPGFVVIHEDVAGGPGAGIGLSAINTGPAP